MKQKNEFDLLDEEKFDFRKLIPVAIVVVLIIVIVAVWLIGGKKRENPNPIEDSTQISTQDSTQSEMNTQQNSENKQEETGAPDEDLQGSSMGNDSGAVVDEAQLLSASSIAENNQVTLGIDVAKYQGTIDWAQVANSGVNFAMIRVGYRTQKTGEMCVDSNAKYNMQEAAANGIKVGVYFFSAAVTEEEAREEADWVADYISQYPITYPVAFDCEGFEQSDSRQSGLSNAQRTDIAIAFMNEIYQKGYTPMFYAAKNELEQDSKWDTGRIENSYKVWVSQYPEVAYPQTASSSYSRTHAMWQYTNQGSVAGIRTSVDLNVAYFGYDGTGSAQNATDPGNAQADPEALMKFTDVNESVTAKDTTNLRDIPSQDSDSHVVATIENGEVITKTGESTSGWSRVEYNGQTLYAVSSYLTSDLNYKPVSNEQETGGFKTKFRDCNENVTAKDEVNLRTKPSVTDSDSTVAATLHNGETAVRTGVNDELGWSRVEYNGQTLYCVTSYLVVQ